MVKTNRSIQKSGQRAKKGQTGRAVQYITRAKAIRKLQVTLKDFRRLSILKGVFPRQAPDGKDKGKVYYHIKDINYLQHDPLIQKIRDTKVYLRRKAHYKGRHEEELAEGLREPMMKLDHLVRERYPTFTDALRDLQDPLTDIFLFRSLPVKVDMAFLERDALLAQRLVTEWIDIVQRKHALRKVFVTIKGYCYQAEINGVSITWLTPHATKQDTQQNIDYDLLMSFLRFGFALMRCVNCKLYKEDGIIYPYNVPSEEEYTTQWAQQHLPKQQQKKQNTTGLQKQKALKNGSKHVPLLHLPSHIIKDALTLDSKARAHVTSIPLIQKELSSASASSKQQTITTTMNDNDDDSDNDDDNNTNTVSNNDTGDQTEFESLDPSLKITDSDGIKAATVFKGCIVYVSREVPFEPISLVVRSGGGIAIRETLLDVRATTLPIFTHKVIDRPELPQQQQQQPTSKKNKITTPAPQAFSIQPQWIFDSFNMRSLLPISAYAPGVKLPPHLSPFVDNVKENYIPEQLNTLRSWVGLPPLSQSALTKIRKTEEDIAREKENADEAEYQSELGKESSKKQTAAKNKKSITTKEQSKQQVAAPQEDDDEQIPQDDDDDIEMSLNDDEMGDYNQDDDDDDDEDDGIELDDDDDDDDNEDDLVTDDDDDDDIEEQKIKNKLQPVARPSTFNARDDDKQLSKIVMPKKDKRLHNRMMFGINEQKKKAQVLVEKREAIKQGDSNPQLSQVGSKLRRKR